MSNKAFVKFPSLRQFRDVCKSVHKVNKGGFSHLDEDNNPVFKSTVLPKLDFEGTVKVHGTNAGICVWDDLEVTYQSRNRLLGIGNDNAGFAGWATSVGEQYWIDHLAPYLTTPEEGFQNGVFIYGEWCGQNIQGGVSITGMEKAFIVFSLIVVKVDKSTGELVNMEFLDKDFYELDFENKGHRIFHTFDFETFEITLDFNDTDSMREILDTLRDKVEENCPVGAMLNPKTENTIGEGIVFKCVTEGYDDQSFMFKYKGEKHQRSGKGSKVPTRLPSLTDEQQKLVDAFYLEALKEDRLLQGVEYLKEMYGTVETKHIGEYIKWVSGDIIKEMQPELNELVNVGLEWRRLCGVINKSTREYLIAILDN